MGIAVIIAPIKAVRSSQVNQTSLSDIIFDIKDGELLTRSDFANLKTF
jgi:hypothetical protein